MYNTFNSLLFYSFVVVKKLAAEEVAGTSQAVNAETKFQKMLTQEKKKMPDEKLWYGRSFYTLIVYLHIGASRNKHCYFVFCSFIMFETNPTKTITTPFQFI